MGGDGTDRGFGEKDLDRVVENFAARKVGSPNDVPAPWHLGHEDDRLVEGAFLKTLVKRTDLPALAEPTRLWRKGAELWSEVQVPEIALPLLALYPSRSAEIYRDFRGQGPTLKGVGLLGATQPAKKGLGPVVLNDASGSEYVVTDPVRDAITFMEPMPQTGMGPKLLKKIQSIAAAEDGKTTDSVLQDVAKAARMDSASLLGLLTGQSDVVLSAEQAAGIATALGMTMAEVQAGGMPAEDEEDAMKDPKAAKAEAEKAEAEKLKAKKPVEAMAEGPTAEQFNELVQTVAALQAGDREKNELLTAQKHTIAALQTQNATVQAERFNERLEALVQRDLLDTGRISPAHKERVVKLLRPFGGVEKFAEGETGLVETVGLLKDLLVPKTESAVRRPVHNGSSDQRIKGVLQAFAEHRRLGMRGGFETFAELAHALTPEEIVAAKAQLPAELKA